MMPALTIANLATWFLQVTAIVVIVGAAMHVGRLQSPRVRLACLRATLLVGVVAPLIAVSPAPRAVERPGVVASARDGGAALETTVLGQRDASALERRPASRANSASRRLLEPPPATWLAAFRARAERTLDTALPASARIAAFLAIVVGMLARLAWLGLGLVALRRLRREGRSIAVVAPARSTIESVLREPRHPQRQAIASAANLVAVHAEFLVSDRVKRPVTFGLRRPVVLLPESFAGLEECEQTAIATHELLHVRRRDWLQTIAEELLRAVFWFHPAIWWLLGHIDLCREQVVDQEVVALTERRRPYLNALVRLALGPSGPVLRPASLFLGRAHLLRRVALLSREVRMSRWRLAGSVLLVAVALVVGGRMVVQAFPLMSVPPVATPASHASPELSFGTHGVPSSEVAAIQRSATWPAMGTSPALVSPLPVVLEQEPASAHRLVAAKVVQRVPPAVTPGGVEPGQDAIVAIEATVNPAGFAAGPVSIAATGGVQASASDIASADGMIDTRFMPPATAERMRAVLYAMRQWRFEAGSEPTTAYVGFNFAGDQAALSAQPIRVGGTVRQPVKIKDVRPVYPENAQARGIQGVVILEVLIDGAGVPVQAVALRSIDELTMAAIQAALQWRFTPIEAAAPIVMTVTVNFTLAGPPAVYGGGRGGVQGGITGGVQGGVAGGIVGGLGGGQFVSRPDWPSTAVRVGGNIKPPTKTKDVRPEYPADAIAARVQGVVIVELLIGPDGKVADAKILRSIPMFDQAALDAVRQWEFTPTLLNGNPVNVIMTATVNFSLQ